MSEEEPLRIVLADDHPLFRHGLRQLLEQVAGRVVVAEAADGEAAVAAVAEHAPDVVVMDLTMPRLSGLEATRRVAAEHPGSAVLVLTMNEDDASVFAALRAGARGYVLKGCPSRSSPPASGRCSTRSPPAAATPRSRGRCSSAPRR
jgi:DNA-binding NarL/FixJ family response regulator